MRSKARGLSPCTLVTTELWWEKVSCRSEGMKHAPSTVSKKTGTSKARRRKGQHGASFSVTYLDSLDTTRDRALFSSFSFLFSALSFSNCWKKENEQSWKKRCVRQSHKEKPLDWNNFFFFCCIVGTANTVCQLWEDNCEINNHKS